MRLTAQQVKQGIVHPDQTVRDVAVRYFGESFSDDPTVMPLAIRAIETYGWEDAFEYLSCIGDLAQTEDTLLWLVSRLNRMGRPTTSKESEHCHRLSSVIADCDVALLMKHEQALLGLEGLTAEGRDVMADRLRLLTLDGDSCWAELERLCEEHKGVQYINKFPVGRAFRLCEAIARDGGCAERVLAILSQKVEDYENNPMAWLECFAARLAGERRLGAAVPLLVAKLKEDGGDLMNEECRRSFIRVGTDAAVEAICADWLSAPWHYRLYASGSLEHIHSDLAVSTCLDLYGQEGDGDVQVNLLRAVLGSFSPEGLGPARDFTNQYGWELRAETVAVATLAGVSFPELEGWRAEEKQAREDRKRRYEQLLAPLPRARPQPPPTAARDLIGPAPPAPMGRKEKVGRNDPCPCGSGKKYKRCCLNKDR
jgi:hypothetical protein